MTDIMDKVKLSPNDNFLLEKLREMEIANIEEEWGHKNTGQDHEEICASILQRQPQEVRDWLERQRKEEINAYLKTL